MKKCMMLLLVSALVLLSSGFAIAGKCECDSVKEGTVWYSAGHYLEGEPLTTGYDIFGYNYQAHQFRGSYFNSYAGGVGFPPWEGDDVTYLEENPEAVSHWAWPYRTVDLIMKWNDAWISNKDCDGDGKLDRHYGYDSYIGSGAWLTNHQIGGSGRDHWTYFTKIVAAPSTAVADDGSWYTQDGVEIGPVIWGAFATIQKVESGEGAYWISPSSPGLGKDRE